MNLFTGNSPYYHLLKYWLFLLKHPVLHFFQDLFLIFRNDSFCAFCFSFYSCYFIHSLFLSILFQLTKNLWIPTNVSQYKSLSPFPFNCLIQFPLHFCHYSLLPVLLFRTLCTPVLHLFSSFEGFTFLYVIYFCILCPLHAICTLFSFLSACTSLPSHHNWSVRADLIMQTQFRVISISDIQNRRMRESERRRV